jgi:tRNA-modifying protein YgfZ
METLKAAPIERDVVIAHGSDARDYLQTQLTQDVVELAVGDSAWSFLLQPKGEIVALVRVTRIGEDRLALDTDAGWGDQVRDRIDGFLFRTDVGFSTEHWRGFAYRGPGALRVDADAPIVSQVRWGGTEGLDVVGPVVEAAKGVEVVDAGSYDTWRVWAGWPMMGADIAAGTTPAMTGLVDTTVSFTKGCYTGQELVARMHYRDAKPPKRLVKVQFHPCAAIAPGTDLTIDGKTVGVVTSIAPCQPVALAYLQRSIDVPSDVTVGGCPGTLTALDRSVRARPEKPPTTTSPLGFQPLGGVV